jgi:hypothetical protein
MRSLRAYFAHGLVCICFLILAPQVANATFIYSSDAVYAHTMTNADFIDPTGSNILSDDGDCLSICDYYGKALAKIDASLGSNSVSIQAYGTASGYISWDVYGRKTIYGGESYAFGGITFSVSEPTTVMYSINLSMNTTYPYWYDICCNNESCGDVIFGSDSFDLGLYVPSGIPSASRSGIYVLNPGSNYHIGVATHCEDSGSAYGDGGWDFFSTSASVTLTIVPEPTTLFVILLGSLGMPRRKSRKEEN